MRFIVDMNLTQRWASFLVDAGHECVHWSDLGQPTAPDREICSYARNHGFVLITNDLDFPVLLAHSSDQKPSVILLRGEPLVPETRGDALLRAIADTAADLECGAVVSIDWFDKVRARLLPLK
jgi:predicted nuclease of predicted toxin-antitoxin system